MNFRLAAFLDVFVGRVLLGLIYLLPPFPKEILKNPSSKNILMIKFWGIT